VPKRKKARRMKFIDDLRAMIIQKLELQNVPADITRAALDQWDAGGEPRTPYERGCFEVFHTIQNNIEKGD